MQPMEMLEATTRSACVSARAQGGSVPRIKADTAERVLERIVSSEITLRRSEILETVERMNHASGTADRSVAVSMLEVLIGVGIRRTA